MFDAAPTPALQQHICFARALTALGTPGVAVGHDLALTRTFRTGLRVAMLARATPDLAALPAQLKKAGLGRTPVILSPDHPMPKLAKLGALALMTPAHVAELTLSDPDHMRAAQHQKWRNRLRRAERTSLRVARQNLPFTPNQPLFAADAAQQRAQNYRAWPVAMTLAYAKANPGQAKLFTAFEGRDAVAAMLILRHGASATYHIGYSTPRGRTLNAHALILWHAALYLAAKGHTLLDLGYLDTHRAPGLARFKLGSGADARKLGGTWGWWPPLGRMLAPLARLDRRAMAPLDSPARS
ncbi:MAG: GNAT family N-acetyltransferase [Sedimentitalea sp.]